MHDAREVMIEQGKLYRSTYDGAKLLALEPIHHDSIGTWRFYVLDSRDGDPHTISLKPDKIEPWRDPLSKTVDVYVVWSYKPGHYDLVTVCPNMGWVAPDTHYKKISVTVTEGDRG